MEGAPKPAQNPEPINVDGLAEKIQANTLKDVETDDLVRRFGMEDEQAESDEPVESEPAEGAPEEGEQAEGAQEEPVTSFEQLMTEGDDGQMEMNFDALKDVPFAGDKPEEVAEEKPDETEEVDHSRDQENAKEWSADAQAALDAAQAKYDAALEKSEAATRKKDIERAEAELSQASDELAAAQKNYDDAEWMRTASGLEKPKSLDDLDLNIVSVQESQASRKKMAEHEAETRFNEERAAAGRLAKMTTYGKIFGGIRKKQLVKEILSEQPNQEIEQENVKRFEQALNQNVDDVLVGGEKLTKVEDERLTMVQRALQNLASETAEGNGKDAYKDFKDTIENWQKDGTLANNKDFSADNILEKGKKVVEIASDLDAYNTSIGGLNRYIRKNVTLNIGEANLGLNTEVYYDRATKAAMIAGVAGAAGIFATNRGIRMASLGAGGGIIGAMTGYEKAKSNINKMNINEALGRSNEIADVPENAKFSSKLFNKYMKMKKGLAEKLGLYEYGDASAEITEKASDVTESIRKMMMRDEDGRVETDEDGNIKWAEGVTDEQKAEFAEYVGKIRAMFEVGSDKNIDLITYDVAQGESLDKVREQKQEATMALADAMRMLRVGEFGDKVTEAQNSYVNALTEQINKINSERRVYTAAMTAKGALIGLGIGALASGVREYVQDHDIIERAKSALGFDQDAGIENAAKGAAVVAGEGDAANAAAAQSGEAEGLFTGEKFTLKNSEVKFIRGEDGNYDAMVDMDNNGYFEETDLKGISFEDGNLTEDSMQKLEAAGFEMTESHETDGVETVSAKLKNFAEWVKGEDIKTVEAHESGDIVDFHRGGWNASADNDVVLGGARLSTDHQNIIIDVTSKNGNVNVDDLEVALTAQDGSNLAFSYDIENGQIEIPREDAAASLFNLGNDGSSMTYTGRYMEVYGANENGLAEIYRTTANDNPSFEDVRLFSHSENTVTEYTFVNAEAGQQLEMRAPMSSYAPEGTNTGVSEWYLDNSATTNGGEIIMSENVVGTLGDGTEIHESFNEGGFNVENDGYFAEAKSSDHAMGGYLWGDEGKVTPENIDHIDKGRLAQEFLDDGQGGLEGTTTLSAYTGTDESLANISDVNERIALLHQDSVAYDNYTNEYWNGLKQDLVDGGYKPDVKLAGGDGTIKLTSYGYIGDDGNVKVAWQVKQATEQEGIFQFNREVNGVETEYLQDTGAVNKILIENGYDPNEYEVVQSGFGMRCSGDNPQIDIFIRKRGSIPGSEGTPTKDTPEGTPTKDESEGTPEKDNNEGMPEKDNNEGTPEKDNTEGTPEKDNNEGTPEKDNTEGTPEKDNNEGTPEKDNNEGTPTKDTPEGTPGKNAEATKNMDDGSGSPDTKAGELEERPEEMSNYNRETQNTPIENNNRNDELIDNADRTLANDTNRTQEQINEQAANAAAEAAAQAQQAADNAADNMAQQAQDLSNLTDEQAAEMFKNGQI